MESFPVENIDAYKLHLYFNRETELFRDCVDFVFDYICRNGNTMKNCQILEIFVEHGMSQKDCNNLNDFGIGNQTICKRIPKLLEKLPNLRHLDVDGRIHLHDASLFTLSEKHRLLQQAAKLQYLSILKIHLNDKEIYAFTRFVDSSPKLLSFLTINMRCSISAEEFGIKLYHLLKSIKKLSCLKHLFLILENRFPIDCLDIEYGEELIYGTFKQWKSVIHACEPNEYDPVLSLPIITLHTNNLYALQLIHDHFKHIQSLCVKTNGNSGVERYQEFYDLLKNPKRENVNNFSSIRNLKIDFECYSPTIEFIQYFFPNIVQLHVKNLQTELEFHNLICLTSLRNLVVSCNGRITPLQLLLKFPHLSTLTFEEHKENVDIKELPGLLPRFCKIFFETPKAIEGPKFVSKEIRDCEYHYNYDWIM